MKTPQKRRGLRGNAPEFMKRKSKSVSKGDLERAINERNNAEALKKLKEKRQGEAEGREFERLRDELNAPGARARLGDEAFEEKSERMYKLLQKHPGLLGGKYLW